MTTLTTLLVAIGTLGSILLAIGNIWLLRPPIAYHTRPYGREGGKR